MGSDELTTEDLLGGDKILILSLVEVNHVCNINLLLVVFCAFSLLPRI